MRQVVLALLALVLLVAMGCASQPPALPSTSTPLTTPPISSAPSTPSAVATSPLTPSGIPSLPPAGSWATEVTNPWFPLTPGTTLTYRGRKNGEATIETYAVTRSKRVVLGVPTTVVHDTLRSTKGTLVEDTLDWYAQDNQGAVWYLGEDTKTYKADGKTVASTDGSWRAGVDGALAGVFMPAQPTVGFQQYQEYFKGQAEDQFSVMSLDATVSVPFGAFTGVLLTSETTALEPAVVSNKYYVRGVGEVYEVDVKGDNEFNKLVAVKR